MVTDQLRVQLSMRTLSKRWELPLSSIQLKLTTGPCAMAAVRIPISNNTKKQNFFMISFLSFLAPQAQWYSKTIKKKVEPSISHILSVGLGLPVCKILRNKPHLFGNYTKQMSYISLIRTYFCEVSMFTLTEKRKCAFSLSQISPCNNGANIQKVF